MFLVFRNIKLIDACANKKTLTECLFARAEKARFVFNVSSASLKSLCYNIF